jgi:hypothetical protein
MKDFEFIGLQQSVVLLMHALDRLLFYRCEGWRWHNTGYNVKVKEDPHGRIWAHIVPAGEPDTNFVSCRFGFRDSPTASDGIGLAGRRGAISGVHTVVEVRDFKFRTSGLYFPVPTSFCLKPGAPSAKNFSQISSLGNLSADQIGIRCHPQRRPEEAVRCSGGFFLFTLLVTF